MNDDMIKALQASMDSPLMKAIDADVAKAIEQQIDLGLTTEEAAKVICSGGEIEWRISFVGKTEVTIDERNQ